MSLSIFQGTTGHNSTEKLNKDNGLHCVAEAVISCPVLRSRRSRHTFVELHHLLRSNLHQLGYLMMFSY
jgi:hypothetical protein